MRARVVFCGIVAAFEIRRLVKLLRRARGTAVIAASPAGLRWRNVAGSPSSGQIARADVNFIIVLLEWRGFGSRSYRLQVHPCGFEKPIVLLLGRAKATLEEVARSLNVAMGIDLAHSSGESSETALSA